MCRAKKKKTLSWTSELKFGFSYYEIDADGVCIEIKSNISFFFRNFFHGSIDFIFRKKYYAKVLAVFSIDLTACYLFVGAEISCEFCVERQRLAFVITSSIVSNFCAK